MAAVDYFLKIDGINGESQDEKHKGEIDLESFSWGETQTGTFAAGGGGGAGKVLMQDFSFVKKLDKSSPVIFISCAEGTHIKQACLTARKAGKGQQDYLQIKMTDVLVSSYQVSGSEGSGIVPTEQVGIDFSKIEYSYKEQKPDGSLGPEVKQGYDVKQMKKV